MHRKEHCKYVTSFASVRDAKRLARAMRAQGYRTRVRKHKGSAEVVSCGRRR